VLLSQRLNVILRGPFFGPWDMEGIPEETVEQILSLEKIGELQAGFTQVENRFAEWRAQHGGI